MASACEHGALLAKSFLRAHQGRLIREKSFQVKLTVAHRIQKPPHSQIDVQNFGLHRSDKRRG